MNKTIKNILSALAVIVFGFILLIATFLLAALFSELIRLIARLFAPEQVLMESSWLPPLSHILFVILILGISWPILKSRMRVLFKAICLVVPLAVVLATLGMFLYSLPAILYVVGALIVLSILYYLYRTKKHWLYYYTTILISLGLTIFTLLGGEI